MNQLPEKVKPLSLFILLHLLVNVAFAQQLYYPGTD